MEEIVTQEAPAKPVFGDSYLRFPDKETADAVLQDYQGSIDIIGEITKIVDSSDPENPVIEILPGWHVNTRGEVTAEMETYLMNPDPVTPYRVWA